MMTRLLLLPVLLAGVFAAGTASAAPRKSPPPVRKLAPPARVAPPVAPSSPAAVKETVRPRLGPVHVTFGEHEVVGDFARRGGVFLFERVETQPRSMLHRRDNFRSDIVASVQ